jgi:hypothetical protein
MSAVMHPYPSVIDLQQAQRRTRIAATAILLLGTIALSALLVSAEFPILGVAITGLCFGGVVAGTIWRKPIIGLYILLFAALFIEQFGIAGLDPITTQTHFFETLSGFSPIPLSLSAADMVMGLMFLALLLPALARQRPPINKGALFVPAMAFLASVIWAFIYGYIRGGFNQKAAIAEGRPFIYLVICYLLAANLLTTRRQLYTFAWCVILGSGLKGIQGIDNYLTEKKLGVSLEAITSHEEVLFFSGFIVLLAALALYKRDSRQLRVMLYLLLPLVFTLLATKRRIGFIVLALGLVLVAFSLLHSRRELLLKVGPPIMVLVLAYFVIFWNAQGALGQPVRAFRSQIGQASERDRLSNLWREAEKANIAFNIKKSPVLGLGYGQPYQFVVFEANLDDTGFVYWRYITHNAIFWVWMTMGLGGFVAFWYLLGSGIALGLATFRRLNDGYLQALALFAVGMIIMQIFFSYGDLGLTYARNMIYLGCLLGMIVRLPALEALPEPPGPRFISVLRASRIGSWGGRRWQAGAV